MPIRLISFDLDSTLAEIGKGILPQTAEALRRFEQRGVRILLNSGKNASYLLGVARGVGIERPLIIGESGSVILDPSSLTETVLAERHPVLDEVETALRRRYGSAIWFQPNQVVLTVFPRDLALIPEIGKVLRGRLEALGDQFALFEHADAVDVLPTTTHKGRALGEVKRLYGFATDEVASVGDAATDLPMFPESRVAVIIGTKIQYPGAHQFATIDQAMLFLEALL